MQSEIGISLEIAKEVRRLEEMYKHYKKLYRRVRFLCCTNEKAVAKYHKDEYKKKLKEMTTLQSGNV